MGKFKLMLTAVMVMGMMLGYAGMAHAVAITCGGCHSVPPVDTDPYCAGSPLPRALHGMHVNYSSVTFKKTVASNGKCSYCHTSVPDVKGVASSTHNNTYLNVTGGNTVNTIHATGLSFNKTTRLCTQACHKNRSDTAKWGNYTATTVGNIKLNCQSCHDDITNAATSLLSGAHKTHLLSVVTTIDANKMGAAGDLGCQNCHPNNVNDLFSTGKVDDGRHKAYPHAQDGTNVVSDNAVVSRTGMTVTRVAGSADTCASACHANATLAWNTTMNCQSCHYAPSANGTGATSDTANNASLVPLSAGHNPHFKAGNGFACTNCHNAPASSIGHAGALPPKTYNAVLLSSLGYTRPAKTCTNTGATCHGTGQTTPAFGSTGNGCGTCHFYPTAPSRDWAAGNGHMVRYDAPVVNTHLKATGYTVVESDYTTCVKAANRKCGLCHYDGATAYRTNHRNGTINVYANGNGNCGGNFTITVTTTGSNVTCNSVKCHSGKTTPNWY